MTYVYEWFGMPQNIHIRCPKCQQKVHFQFPLVFPVPQKKYRPFFESHATFETALLYHPKQYIYQFCAIFYPALHPNPEQYLNEIPKGYKFLEYSARFLMKNHGVVTCSSCFMKAKYMLKWPEDAYYYIEYKGQLLWAYHLDAFISIYDYIQSKQRHRRKSGHVIYLLHIPHHFLTQHARNEVIKKMHRLLNNTAKRP